MKTCNEDRIKQFLRDELTVDDQHHLEQHLESCETCRVQLEDSTADAQWWNEASQFLSDEENDLESVSTFVVLDEDDDLAENVLTSKKTAVGQFVKLLDASDDPRMLGRFGGYEIAGVIGAGGMSFVLKGFDSALNRYAAIKVLAPHLATSGAARRRFAREAQAAAAVVHDNVIAIHSVAECNDLPYLVMPYERGNSLQARLDESGPLQLKEILRIGMQSAAGLAAAHAQGLVHRDIKPANILLADNVERVKLTDFGLARAADDASLTRTGMIAGTPQYMSPEQARGDAVDQRSDLFSLGSVIYAMCTGRPPFRASSSYGVLMRISNESPRPIREVNSEIPDWLCQVVARLHGKSPEDRMKSAEDVAEQLEQCLAHVQQPLREPLPVELQSVVSSERPVYSSDRMMRTTLAITTLLFAVLSIGAIWFAIRDVWLLKNRSESPANDSQYSQSVDPKAAVTSPLLSDENAIEWDDGTDELLQSAELELEELETSLEIP